MNTTDRLLVFSDLHMAPQGPLNNFHAGLKLAACLRKQCRPDTLLVLNGDIFDFLQLEQHPRRLAPEELPSLIQSLLDQVAETPWGREVFQSLRDHITSGGRCLYLPGNHDPEMAHPEAEQILRRALGLEPDDTRLSIYAGSEPLSVKVGRWPVLIGHGHRSDEWNNVDVAQVRKAATEGTGSPSLPLGSLLVLDTLNALKRERDPLTGAPYSFIDLLKPETLAILALALWAAPQVTSRHLPGFIGSQSLALIARIRHRLTDGRYLGPDAPPRAHPPQDLLDALAADLVATLTESERKGNLEILEMELENFFQGRGSASAGMLSGGGRGYSWFGRCVYEKTRHFFDLEHRGDVDQGIIREYLPEGSGPRIVIAGHTHAARICALPGDRLYLNTGSWTDLMYFSEIFNTKDLQQAREQILRGQVPRIQRLCYADVTPEGGKLGWHEPDPARSLKTTA